MVCLLNLKPVPSIKLICEVCVSDPLAAFVRASFSPSVRGRAAEGGRGSLTHHLELGVCQIPSPRPSAVATFFRRYAAGERRGQTTFVTKQELVSPLRVAQSNVLRRKAEGILLMILSSAAHFDRASIAKVRASAAWHFSASTTTKLRRTCSKSERR